MVNGHLMRACSKKKSQINVQFGQMGRINVGVFPVELLAHYQHTFENQKFSTLRGSREMLHLMVQTVHKYYMFSVTIYYRISI